MRLHKVSFILLGVLIGCAPLRPPPKPKAQPSRVSQKPQPSQPQPSPQIKKAMPNEMTVFFYSPHPAGDARKLIKILKDNPTLRLTLIFPEKYFDQPDRKELISQFRMLQSSGQIEIALNLENEPILPLLGNLGLADKKVSSWKFDFAWPEDIATQIANGSGQYQKRWGRLPSGFAPPYSSLSEQVMDSIKRFRLTWVLGKPGSEPGISFDKSTAFFTPSLPPSSDELMEGTDSIETHLVNWVLENAITYVDASR